MSVSGLHGTKSKMISIEFDVVLLFLCACVLCTHQRQVIMIFKSCSQTWTFCFTDICTETILTLEYFDNSNWRLREFHGHKLYGCLFFSTWQEPITPQLHTNLPSWKKIGGLHTPLARLTFVNAYLESPRPAICWSFQPKRCWSSCYGSGCHDARAFCYFSKHVGWKYDGTVLPQPIQHFSPFFGKDRDDCFGGGGPPQSCFEQKGS